MENEYFDSLRETTFRVKNDAMEAHHDVPNEYPYKYVHHDFRPSEYMGIPWHWHREMEFVYVTEGTVEYLVSSGRYVIGEGSGALVNANILHRLTSLERERNTCVDLHIFRPELIVGPPNLLLHKKFAQPIIDSGIDLYLFDCKDERNTEILKNLRESFTFPRDEFYEMELIRRISILFQEVYVRHERSKDENRETHGDDKLKLMMIYVQDHFEEKITVADIAGAAFISERDCFRTFEKYLKTTPNNYIRAVRLENALLLLTETDLPLTEVARRSGMGESSYFGATIKKATGLTPKVYRTMHRAE